MDKEDVKGLLIHPTGELVWLGMVGSGGAGGWWIGGGALEGVELRIVFSCKSIRERPCFTAG